MKPRPRVQPVPASVRLIRCLCGAIVGALLGAWLLMRFEQHRGFVLWSCAVGVTVVAATAATVGGDRFWLWLANCTWSPDRQGRFRDKL